MLANEVDPGEIKKEQQAADSADSETFEVIAREWHSRFAPSWAESHAGTIIRRFELYVFPWLGTKSITSISAKEMLAVLRRVEEKGIIETAHRIQQSCGRVFRYAIATGRADRDPTGDLRGALPPANTKHMASITNPKEIGGLLRAIDGYNGSIVTRCALRLAPLVFV